MPRPCPNPCPTSVTGTSAAAGGAAMTSGTTAPVNPRNHTAATASNARRALDIRKKRELIRGESPQRTEEPGRASVHPWRVGTAACPVAGDRPISRLAIEHLALRWSGTRLLPEIPGARVVHADAVGS